MTQKLVVQLIDDLTQEPIEAGAGDTVRFGLDGVGYAIDLSDEHASELRDAIRPYLDAGRPAESAGRPTSKRAQGEPKRDLKAIRAWASQQGYSISDRGRIPAEVQAAYDRR